MKTLFNLICIVCGASAGCFLKRPDLEWAFWLFLVTCTILLVEFVKDVPTLLKEIRGDY